MALARRVPADFSRDAGRQNADGERVLEDERAIQHLMRGPSHGNAQGRPAVRLLLSNLPHNPILLIQIPGKRMKPFRPAVRQ